MNIYIALKQVIWRFRICNYFCEISKFHDFMNTLRNFAKSVFADISAKFKYFAQQFILTESPDHVLYTYFQWTEDGQGFQIQYLTLDT